MEHHIHMFGTYPNGSLYLRIFLAAENKWKEDCKERLVSSQSTLKFKMLKGEESAFWCFLSKCFIVFLLSQKSRSPFDYGVCTSNQISLFGSEEERNTLIFKVHVILFSLLKSRQEGETCRWWSPNEKCHKWYMLMKPGWLMPYIGWQISLCRFFSSLFLFPLHNTFIGNYILLGGSQEHFSSIIW